VVPSSYPSVPHKCRVFTYGVDSSLCRVTRVAVVGLRNHHYTTLSLQIRSRGVHLSRIHASYPCMTSHLSGLVHRRSGGMCLDTTLHPIRLDTGTLNDYLVWSMSGRPSFYCVDRSWIRMPCVTCQVRILTGPAFGGWIGILSLIDAGWRCMVTRSDRD
jgi:hypothetical protein